MNWRPLIINRMPLRAYNLIACLSVLDNVKKGNRNPYIETCITTKYIQINIKNASRIAQNTIRTLPENLFDDRRPSNGNKFNTLYIRSSNIKPIGFKQQLSCLFNSKSHKVDSVMKLVTCFASLFFIFVFPLPYERA